MAHPRFVGLFDRLCCRVFTDVEEVREKKTGKEAMVRGVVALLSLRSNIRAMRNKINIMGDLG